MPDDVNPVSVAVAEAIRSEKAYQIKHWGGEGRDHEVASWITYMRSYLEEAANLVSRSSGHDLALHAIRKVVTLGVVCMEEHGALPRRNS